MTTTTLANKTSTKQIAYICIYEGKWNTIKEESSDSTEVLQG